MNGLADVVDMGGGDTQENPSPVGGRPHFMTTYGEGGLGKISDSPHNTTMGGISVDQQPIQGGGAPSTADKIGSGVSGFFNYMTNFDQKTKCDLLISRNTV